MTESFAELFEQSQTQLAKLKPGAIVTGVVVEVRNDEVVISEIKENIAKFRTQQIVPRETTVARP